MNTCKDCIYYFKQTELHGECRLYPKAQQMTDHEHWCGQLKENERWEVKVYKEIIERINKLEKT